MFAWQFLFSGPLEIASAGIGTVQYLSSGPWPLLAAHSLAMKSGGVPDLLWFGGAIAISQDQKTGPADVRAVDGGAADHRLGDSDGMVAMNYGCCSTFPPEACT